MAVNHVVLIGRLTRNQELKYTNSGMAVGKFSLAVNRRKRQGDQWTEEVNFFDITIFGKTAENLNQYLTKGKEIAVEGELRQNRWQDDNGNNRSKVEVVGNNIQLLGGGRKEGGDQGEYTPDEVDSGFDDSIPF